MRTLAFAGLIGAGMLTGLAPAHAVGCVSGALVGGVAGHVAGHHGLLGAAAGCAVGHHEAVRRKREAAAHEQMERQGPDRQTYGRDAYRDDAPRPN